MTNVRSQLTSDGDQLAACKNFVEPDAKLAHATSLGHQMIQMAWTLRMLPAHANSAKTLKLPLKKLSKDLARSQLT